MARDDREMQTLTPIEQEFDRVGDVIHNAYSIDEDLTPSAILGPGFADFDGRVRLYRFNARSGHAWLMEVTNERPDGRDEMFELLMMCGSTFGDPAAIADLLRLYRVH